MSKEIMALIGYNSNNTSLEYSKADVIAEIETGGSDSDGFKNNETIGLAKDIYGSHFLYRGSKDSNLSDKHMVAYFSDDGQSISKTLYELSEALKK